MVFLIPYSRHIELRVVAYATQDLSSWKTGLVTYQFREIKGVIVIVFNFSDKESDFMIHLNYPGIQQAGAVSCLYCKNLAFMIMLLDPIDNNMIIALKIINITKEDTDQIRECCEKQYGMTQEVVDAKIDFIYGLGTDQALAL